MNNKMLTIEDRIHLMIDQLKTKSEMDGLTDLDQIMDMTYKLKSELEILSARNIILDLRQGM